MELGEPEVATEWIKGGRSPLIYDNYWPIGIELFGPNTPGVLELEPAGTITMEIGTLFPTGALEGINTCTSYTPIRPGACRWLTTCIPPKPGMPACTTPAT